MSVTSFGLTGPYAGYLGGELIHYAVGGPLSASGKPDREPVKMGADLGQYQCGSVAAVAALAAVSITERTGRGIHIDLANVDTQVTSIDRRMTYLLYGAYRNADVPRFGGYAIGPLPGGVRPTEDGHVQVSTLPNWIPRALRVLADPDLAARYQSPTALFDPELPEIADAALLGWTLTRGKQQAMEEAQAAGWPITAVNQPRDLLVDPHLSQRGFFVDVEHPLAGTVRQPGVPIRMAETPPLRAAPRLGSTTEAEARALLQRQPTGGREHDELPLAGLRVLDLTVVWAGPYATMFLGDLGAEVIRVDNPFIFPSATRGVLPRPPASMVEVIGGIFGGYPDADPGERPWNRVALFTAHARGKKSVTLDLRSEHGREAFLKLAEKCDVLIENNSAELLDKLGIGWEALHARNPRLIAIRMPSVGLDGPYRDYLGFGVNFEGLCGLTALRGYADLDASENEPVFHMDAASGAAGAFAALAALRRREATGVGELVELSQSENMLNHIGELLIEASWTGEAHERLGNRDRVHAPQGVYPALGDDAWLAVSIQDDDQWDRFCSLISADDLRGLSLSERRQRHDELDARIAEWTAQRSPSQGFVSAQEAGVPAGPVMHELDSLADPHFRARDLFKPSGSTELGTHDYPAYAWRWDGPEQAWGPIPLLGEHNEDVLRRVGGLSEAEIAALRADGQLSADYLGPDGKSL